VRLSEREIKRGRERKNGVKKERGRRVTKVKAIFALKGLAMNRGTSHLAFLKRERKTHTHTHTHRHTHILYINIIVLGKHSLGYFPVVSVSI
jgi:hypothetical protein